jgi:heme O synthase-like polyprenyltransferase
VASEPILAASDLSLGKRALFYDSKIWFEYFALTKPEVNFLIVVTTFAGFYLGCAAEWRDFPFLRSINAVLATFRRKMQRSQPLFSHFRL